MDYQTPAGIAVVRARAAYHEADMAAASAIVTYYDGRVSLARMQAAQDEAMRAAEALELAENALAKEQGRTPPYHR